MCLGSFGRSSVSGLTLRGSVSGLSCRSSSSFPAALLWLWFLSVYCYDCCFSRLAALVVVSLDLLLWPSFCLGLQCGPSFPLFGLLTAWTLSLAQWLLPASDEFGFFMSGRRGTPFEGPNTFLFGVSGQLVVASWPAWSSGFSTSCHFISIWHSRDFILIFVFVFVTCVSPSLGSL
jgi:hypothetical protein